MPSLLQEAARLARTENTSPLSSLPMKSQFFLPDAIGLKLFSARLLSIEMKPCSVYFLKDLVGIGFLNNSSYFEVQASVSDELI